MGPKDPKAGEITDEQLKEEDKKDDIKVASKKETKAPNISVPKTSNPDCWHIMAGFNLDMDGKSVRIGPGEQVPEGLSGQELDTLWKKGFIAKRRPDGTIYVHPKVVNLPQDKIINLLKKEEKVILDTLKRAQFSQETYQAMYLLSQDKSINGLERITNAIQKYLIN